jgi:hypothetical protein
MDRVFAPLTQRQVKDLRIGDRVDLQGDSIADNGEHPEFEFEFESVAEIEPETKACTVIHFDSGFSCGFPPDHWLTVDAEQVRAES